VKRISLFIMMLLPVTTPVAADTGVLPAADLAALLREADAGSPVLRAAQARLEAARRIPSQARSRPDPEIGIAYQNEGVRSFSLGESETSFLALNWSQEVQYPGKRAAMGDVASREAEREESDVMRMRLAIGATVKAAWADLYRLDQTAAILAESRSVLGSLAEGARRRYEVGQGILESVLKAETEILRLDAEIATVAQERRAAEVGLDALVGRSAGTPIGPITSLPSASPSGVTLLKDAEDLAQAAVAASPEIAGLEAAVRRQESGVRLARLDLKPDFFWSASYQNRDGLDPMIMGSFGVRLPLYRKQKQAQALLQRESELTAARGDLLAGKLTTGASARDLVSQLERADRLLVLFREGVIPQARSALESAQSAYSSGRIGFLDLLNDLTVLLNARIDLAVQEADRLRVLARLEPLLVRELIHVPGAPEPLGAREAPDGSADQESQP